MQHLLPIPADSPLKDAVSTIFQMERLNPLQSRETVVPKGVVEVIFNLSEDPGFLVHIGEESYPLPRCFINGFNSQPIYLSLPRHQVFFGAVFHTVAVQELLGVPPGEFANHCLDGTDIDASFSSLWHQLADQKTFEQRVIAFSAWVLQRLPSDLGPKEQLLQRFLSHSSKPVRTVPELSDWLCYSPRHLSRKLKALTGMNTEEALLYKKYLEAIGLMHHTQLSLTEIAHQCHFSDQAHFSKTFKSFTQLTPRQYRQAETPLLGHLLENVR